MMMKCRICEYLTDDFYLPGYINQEVCICNPCSDEIGRVIRILNYLDINPELIEDALRYVEAQNASKAVTEKHTDKPTTKRREEPSIWHDYNGGYYADYQYQC